MANSTGVQTDSDTGRGGHVLGQAERLQFERLVQWLRLSLLITVPVLVVSGPAAVAASLWIIIAVAGVVAFVELLIRYRPELLLRTQLALRMVDCGLMCFVLVQLHALLHNAYYDAAYALCVGAASATHGRRGGWTVAGLAGVAVLAGRLQLISSGGLPFEIRQMMETVLYTIFFLATSSGVDFLMRKSEEVGMRREGARHTELVARNQELERIALERSQAIQRRDAFLTGVTHDLRHPLTVIRIRARLLRRSLATRYGEHIEHVEHIERSAIRITSGIDELSTTTSVEEGQHPPLTLVSTDLVQLVRDAIDEYQSILRHRLVLDAHAPSIAGRFDAQRLERALDNLVANAMKYSPDGSDIRLELSAGADWAKVVIRDQGIGIPTTDLPHVFEPFRRGANVVGRIKGSGIGLANARRIVEQHGGALSVESAPGKGSTFIVRLPLEPSPV